MITFIEPPRPESCIPASMIAGYEKRGWIAQIKKNGTNTVIFMDTNGKLFPKTRHGEDHKAWKLTEASSAIFASLKQFAPLIVVAELLHSKVPGIRDTLYFHDILMLNGNIMYNSSYKARWNFLAKVFDYQSKINDNAYLAQNYDSGFVNLANSLKDAIDEGLVFKNPNGLWMPGKTATWTVKWRKATKNYSF